MLICFKNLLQFVNKKRTTRAEIWDCWTNFKIKIVSKTVVVTQLANHFFRLLRSAVRIQSLAIIYCQHLKIKDARNGPLNKCIFSFQTICDSESHSALHSPFSVNIFFGFWCTSQFSRASQPASQATSTFFDVQIKQHFLGDASSAPVTLVWMTSVRVTLVEWHIIKGRWCEWRQWCWLSDVSTSDVGVSDVISSDIGT